MLAVLCVPVYGWAMGPCMPIAQACMQQGSYGDRKTIVEECVLPVAQGQKTLPNTNFTQEQLQQCLAAIQKEMQAGGTI